MSDLVHYLIRHPRSAGGLLYPSDVEDESYQGIGGFYLLDVPDAPLRPWYLFPAVLREEIIRPRLVSMPNSPAFYQAEIPDVGRFYFHAENLGRTLAYVGSDQLLSGLVARRRLRSLRPDALEEACRVDGFYFIGHSPRVHELESQ